MKTILLDTSIDYTSWDINEAGSIEMTDDLVERLRNPPFGTETSERNVMHEAADRIEKLETNFQLQLEWYLSNKRVLDDRIEKLEAALREAMNDIPGWYDLARKALEGKDD